MTRVEELALDAWAIYEYREHPKGLYHTCFIDGYQKGYEQAEKDLGWISAKDRLPEEPGWYITCCEDNGVAQAIGLSFYNSDKQSFLDYDDIRCALYVDYWMEIPKLKK